MIVTWNFGTFMLLPYHLHSHISQKKSRLTFSYEKHIDNGINYFHNRILKIRLFDIKCISATKMYNKKVVR